MTARRLAASRPCEKGYARTQLRSWAPLAEVWGNLGVYKQWPGRGVAGGASPHRSRQAADLVVSLAVVLR